MFILFLTNLRGNAFLSSADFLLNLDLDFDFRLGDLMGEFLVFNCLITSGISGLDICMDISHTALSSNYFKFDFYHLLHELIDQTAHLHIADASKSNQEGQQIGEGDLDFTKLLKIYTNTDKSYSFIPEIWQGHLNEGEGFHKALSIIEECIGI